MDPITIIMSALTAAGTAVGDQAIKDGYQGLKALLVRKFGGQDAALEPSLTKLEQKPDVWQEPTAETLKAVGADQDQEVLKVAQALLEQLNRHDGAQVMHVQGTNVNVVGRDQHGNVTFGG